MKKRAHIPHNYEMSFEIRREGPASGIHPSRKAQQYVSFNGGYLKFNSKIGTKDVVDMSSTSSKSTTSFSSITRLLGTSFFLSYLSDRLSKLPRSSCK